MSNFRDGYIERGSPLGMTYADLMLSADNQLVNPSGLSLIRLTSDNATFTNRTFTIRSGDMVGHELRLEFMHASNACELAASGNMQLAYSAGWVPVQYDSIDLIWDGTYWVERARNQLATATVLEAKLAPQTTAGLHAQRVAHGIFDASAGKATSAFTLGATIPINSFVTGVWYWVKTTFTSATDAGTIALSIQAANDVVSAIAISDVSNPWDLTTLPVEGITKIETTSTFLKSSAARALTATVAVEALTAGVMHVWATYVVIE